MRTKPCSIVIALVAIACSSPVAINDGMLCACPPLRGHAVVSGTLTTEVDIAPAFGVQIQSGRTTETGCDFSDPRAETTPSYLPVRGETFSIRVFSDAHEGVLCLRAVARSEGTVPLFGQSEGGRVQLRSERERPDTLTVQVVMRSPS